MCICEEIWTQTFPDSHTSTRECTHVQWLLCDLPPGLSTLRAACTWDGPTTSSSCASPGLWLVAEDGDSWCWRDEPCRCCQEQAATSSKLKIRLLLRAAQVCRPALALPLQTECGSSGLTVVPKRARSLASSTSVGLGSQPLPVPSHLSVLLVSASPDSILESH